MYYYFHLQVEKSGLGEFKSLVPSRMGNQWLGGLNLACSAPTGTRCAEKSLSVAPSAHVWCMVRLEARGRARSKTSVSQHGTVFAEELLVF